MTEAVDIIIREAIPDDAKQVLSFLNKVATQTEFITQSMDSNLISVEEEEKQLDAIYVSDNNCVVLALADERIIGMATVQGSAIPKVKHIGEVGIVIDEVFWRMGLGRLLMEEVIYWSQEFSVIKRLELKVQERNERARALYQKVGFKEEAIMERGAQVDGKYFNVCLMSKLI